MTPVAGLGRANGQARMKVQRVGAFELARQRPPEFRGGEQARDFPFVLGGEKLVVERVPESQRLAQAGFSSAARARSTSAR